MTEAEFSALAAQGYNRIPLVLETFADLDTPLSLYLKLANQPVHLPARIGASAASASAAIRSSACRRATRIDVRGDTCIECRRRQTGRRAARAAIRSRSSTPTSRRFKAAPLPGLPRFCGGLVGYFGYDTVRYIEPRLARPRASRTRCGTPDILLLLSEELAVVDNLVRQALPDGLRRPGAARCVRRRAGAAAANCWPQLREPVAIPAETRAAGASRRDPSSARRLTRRRCERAKGYIAAGDIMQVVLSQRLAQPFARVAAVAVPRAALAQSVAVHVLLRLRRFPRGRRLARDPGAARKATR